MRIRTLAGAVVVAAGLSVALTGAASAAGATDDPPPAADIHVVTCEDGRPVERELTEEERERIEEVRERVEAGEIEAGAARRVLLEDGNVIVFRGEVPPDVERARRAHEVLGDVPGGVRGDVRRDERGSGIPHGGPDVACAAPALPPRP